MKSEGDCRGRAGIDFLTAFAAKEKIDVITSITWLACSASCNIQEPVVWSDE